MMRCKPNEWKLWNLSFPFKQEIIDPSPVRPERRCAAPKSKDGLGNNPSTSALSLRQVQGKDLRSGRTAKGYARALINFLRTPVHLRRNNTVGRGSPCFLYLAP